MKKALITWWTKWLWLEISKVLSSEGIEVVSLSRNPIDDLSSHLKVDLTSPDSIDSTLSQIKDFHSEFDYLILCAWDWEVESFWEINIENIQETINLNLSSNIQIVNWLLNLIEKNSADIIVMWATIWYKSNIFMPVYSIAKWWLRGFIENIREKFKNTKTRIINVAPWWLNTDSNIWENWREKLISKITWKENLSLIDAWKLASLIYSIISLPKNTEVSEIIINRK